MNLGQAVAVCLYEISRLPNLGSAGTGPEPVAANSLSLPVNQPNSEQLDRLAELIEETMESVNYATRGMRSANGEALRILLRRLMPQDADLRRIMEAYDSSRHIQVALLGPGGQVLAVSRPERF